MTKSIKELVFEAKANKNIYNNTVIREEPLMEILSFISDSEEFSCTKETISNLSSHLEYGKEYVVLVKKVED